MTKKEALLIVLDQVRNPDVVPDKRRLQTAIYLTEKHIKHEVK